MSDMRDTNGVPDGIDVGDDDDLLDDAPRERLDIEDADDIDDAENLGLMEDDVDRALDGRIELREP